MIFIRSSNCWCRDFSSLISLIRASSTTISFAQEVVAGVLVLDGRGEVLVAKEYQRSRCHQDAAKNHQEPPLVRSRSSSRQVEG